MFKTPHREGVSRPPVFNFVIVSSGACSAPLSFPPVTASPPRAWAPAEPLHVLGSPSALCLLCPRVGRRLPDGVWCRKLLAHRGCPHPRQLFCSRWPPASLTLLRPRQPLILPWFVSLGSKPFLALLRPSGPRSPSAVQERPRPCSLAALLTIILCPWR